MPNESFPRDRFDDVPERRGRIGAHRAENPRMRGGVVFLWAAAATIVLVAAGVFGTLVASGRIDLSPPAASATATPEPEVTATVDTSYEVLVLNATPVEGLAGQLTDDIVAAGWKSSKVLASGASSQDFRTTTVFYPAAEDEAAALGLAEVIGGAAVQEADDYVQDSKKQLTVVIGLDRVSTPTPTATQ
ncbi:MAG: LytR C-terminal domain-containing protein [Microbacterium sp.]|uniref:LytR C-terminal domain-containing protein n=1 Tax=Microbacterium sp. TaxID=51671 RepID=UPI0039E3FE8A